eukprot:EG_transcript_26782
MTSIKLEQLALQESRRDEAYLELHSIRTVFQRVTQGLVTQQPADVHDFVRQEIQAISEEKHGKLHVIFIVRPPGQGEGYCQRLAEEYGFEYIDTAELLADVPPDDLGAALEVFQNVFQTVPEGTVVILDKFPRSIKQALHFEVQVVPCRFLVHFALENAPPATVPLYYAAVEKIAVVPLGLTPEATYTELRAPFLQLLESIS